MRFGIVLAFALVLASMAFASNYPVVPVTFTAINPISHFRAATAPGDVACGTSPSADWSYDGVKLIEIKSFNNFIFGGPNDVMSGDYYFDKILFDPIGLTNNGEILNGTYYQDPNQNNWKPRVFFMVPGRDCWNWNGAGFNTQIGVSASTAPYSYLGIGIAFMPAYNGLPAGRYLNYAEMGGDQNGLFRYVNTALPIYSDASWSTLRFKPSDSSIGIIYYGGFISYTFGSYEPVFVTERGSRVVAVGTTDLSIQVSAQIAKPSFTFGGGPTSSRGYKFETVITDTVDRTLQNRMNTNPEDIWPDSLGADDTNTSTSPLRAVAPGTTLAKNLYRIGGVQYPSFANYVFPDPKIYSFYIGTQSFWVGSTPRAVKYDSDSSIRDISVNTYSAMAYSEKFGGGLESGIPVCTGGVSIQGDWSSCGANSTNRTDMHRVIIKFMGADWVITQMLQPTTPLASSTAAINGGQVRLGKEKAYGTLNLEQRLDEGYFKIKFARLLNNGGATIEIYNPVDILLGQFQMAAGQTFTFAEAKTGRTVKIHLYDAHAIGPAGGAVAEIAAFSDEITLKDGSRYNLVSNTDPNKDFKVSLLWKNLGYTGSGSSTQPDSLREIIIYNTDSFSGVKTVKGDSFNFLATSPAYVVRYEGITPVVTSIGGGNNTGNDSIKQPLPTACPASPIEVDCTSFPAKSAKKWVAGDGCTYACKGEATACKPLSKVECQSGYEATVATDPSGCQSYQCIPSKVCPTPLKVECKTGFALYTYTDSTGCPAYGCFGICPTPAKVECKAGYESYIYTASTGCGAYGCRLATTAKTPAATSTNDKAASAVSAGAFVDEGSDTYAKLMNVLGVYVEQYKG